MKDVNLSKNEVTNQVANGIGPWKRNFEGLGFKPQKCDLVFSSVVALVAAVFVFSSVVALVATAGNDTKRPKIT